MWPTASEFVKPAIVSQSGTLNFHGNSIMQFGVHQTHHFFHPSVVQHGGGIWASRTNYLL